MKKIYLKIIIIFMILFFIFASYSYAANGLDVLQQYQNSNSSSNEVTSKTHPNADTNPLNDEQGNESGQSTDSGSSSKDSKERTGGGFSGGSKVEISEVSADSSGDGLREQSIDEVMSSANDFLKNADTNNTISQENVQKTIDLIYNILLAIGLVVAVVAGVILGIEFMVSSADGQAQVKEKLIPYAVGCVIIFGAFGIWKLVMVLLKTF